MKLYSAVPTFLVDNVESTAHWYMSELGFKASFHPKQPPFVYASLQRDSAELMLLRFEGYRKPELAHLRAAGCWDAYVRMEGVAELYESVRDKPYVRMELTKQSYGDTEFEVRDPNGYIVVFGG